MRAEDRLLSINYLNVLSALEQHARDGLKDPIKDGERGRVRDYGRALLNFLRRAFGQRDKELGRLSEALGIVASGIRDKEGKLLRSLAKATTPGKGFSGEETVTSFPGKIPPKEVVGRLVATVLGLHAENRHDPKVADRVRESLERAVENVLAPAMAWNLVVDVGREHQAHHAEILAAAAEQAGLGGIGKEYEVVQWSRGRVALPSLLMLRAWCLALREDFGLGEDRVVELLAGPVSRHLRGNDIPTVRERLHPKVTEAFGWGEHATERTLAVELANQGGKTAARVDRRLRLLKAAASQEAKEWQALLLSDEERALRTVEKILEDRSDPTPEAAGKAFWLSRHCFRKVSGLRFHLSVDDEVTALDPHMDRTACRRLDRASGLVLGLMELAATQPTAGPDEILLLRRFQAGFATNPRYWRSPAVLDKAEQLVGAYRALDGSKEGLVAHFEARLAMQAWYAGQKDGRGTKAVPGEALRAYHRIFELSPSLTEMVDAEAPIHLFPEVIALLTFGSDGGKKVKKALEDVDLILKCNFGVYLDIDEEISAIEGGLNQAKTWSESRRTARARQGGA